MADYKRYFGHYDEGVFGVKNIDGTLDLSDKQTSAIRENEGFTDKDKLEYETRWIDDLYGTEGATIESHDEKAAYHKTFAGVGLIGKGKWNREGNLDVHWGLDIKRDWTNKEDLEVGSNEHYEWQTRGDVDWAHYEDSNAYAKAWKSMTKSGKYADSSWYGESNYESFMDIDNETTKLEFIREANLYQKGGAEDEATSYEDDPRWDTWDNKYENKFDPEKVEPYTETYLDVPDLIGKANFEAIKKPREVTSKPNLQIKPVSVQRPANIPASFGKV